MEKTKLGVKVGPVGAAVYLLCLYGGYVAAALAVGYVLLCETNGWLRRTAVKALVLSLMFTLMHTAAGLLPDAFGLLNAFLGLFNVSFYPSIISKLGSLLYIAVSGLRLVTMLVMALLALKQRTLVIGFVDGFISKLIS